MPAIRGAKSKKKTRRYTRDLDQITLDLIDASHPKQHQNYKGAFEDLPAAGQHYCIECAKWFDSEVNLQGHRKSKVHKRQVKLLKNGAHTQREAEEAVGLGRDDGVVSRRRDTEMDIDGT